MNLRAHKIFIMFSHSIIIDILRYYFLVYGNSYASLVSNLSENKCNNFCFQRNKQQQRPPDGVKSLWMAREMSFIQNWFRFVSNSTEILAFSFFFRLMTLTRCLGVGQLGSFFFFLFYFFLHSIRYGFEQHYINTSSEKRVLKNVELL